MSLSALPDVADASSSSSTQMATEITQTRSPNLAHWVCQKVTVSFRWTCNLRVFRLRMKLSSHCHSIARLKV